MHQSCPCVFSVCFLAGWGGLYFEQAHVVRFILCERLIPQLRMTFFIFLLESRAGPEGKYVTQAAESSQLDEASLCSLTASLNQIDAGKWYGGPKLPIKQLCFPLQVSR